MHQLFIGGGLVYYSQWIWYPCGK